MSRDASHGERQVDVTAPSVLQQPGATRLTASEPAPACLADLNLDQVIAAITKGRDVPALRAVFHAPLDDPSDVAYRQEVFRDLSDDALRAHVEAFARSMRDYRAHARRAERIRNPLRRQRLRLDGASMYCAALTAITDVLSRHDLSSRGLRDIAAYLHDYVRSPAFVTLRNDVQRCERELDAVTYGLTVLEDRVRVRRASGQHDYGAAVARTFARFRRDTILEQERDEGDGIDMNYVEAAILELVARLYPDAFATLAAFAERYVDDVDPVVERFEREVQFYLAYLAYTQRFEPMGLRFCLPEVVTADKQVQARDTFDLALADTLREEDGAIVCNDFRLDAAERMLVVTGANQGGKTTFARMFGQLHYLAALGCPVPGRAARLFLFDELLTHFDREEDLRTLQGKLQEELTRLQALLDRATSRSIVIMNEAFSSTAADDALALGRDTLERLLATDVLGVYVTFVEELSRFDARIASVTATVDPDQPARRTFKLVRKPADGHAHALAIARAYRLTYDELRLRLRS